MNRENPEISLIIPLYNEEKNISILYNTLKNIFDNILKVSYEIIYIDDGSNDNTFRIIEELNKKDKSVKGICFSRNFGHQIALKAGIDYSNGNVVISMDGDMQHPPEMIPQMIKKWKEGFDIVYTIRKDKIKNNIFKTFTSKFFYKIINWFSDINIESGTADFRLIDKNVIEYLKKINELHLFLRGVISWIGFKSVAIEYEVGERFAGHSKYSLKKMINFAINGIMSFSIKPLRISIFIGFIFSIFAFIYALYALFLKFFTDISIPGMTSILISILFFGGLHFIILGIIGEYIGKIFEILKNRPLYIVEKKIGIK